MFWLAKQILKEIFFMKKEYNTLH